MSQLFKRMMSFRGRWNTVRRQATRIQLRIAEDQLLAWAMHPDSRRRTQAMRGWGDMLRSMVPA